jgi:hypothetical protein
MKNIEKLNSLLNQLEYKLEHHQITQASNPDLRQENLEKIHHLYTELKIFTKHKDFNTLFDYKAMNLSGIGLKDEDFSEIRKGKYVQIISITYEVNTQGKRIPKNSSLGYFGKAEKVERKLKNDIIEFVLRWRYEKTFQHSEHYQQLLSKLHQ